jgi:predicted dehydrogenase
MQPKTILMIGAGSRGGIYCELLAEHSDRVRVIGVAEPRDDWRERFVQRHAIPDENVFSDWREAAERERFADAVIIATPDHLHTEPAIAFAERGYHILLEKPMAPTEEECVRIAGAAKAHDILFAVCHVLVYTPYTRKVKSLIENGAIGTPVTIQHLEPVGYWHHAHAYVRGPWRKEAESSFMLLAKSCHDLDWISHVMDAPITRVSSFGSLYAFRPENAPPDTAERCLDCRLVGECQYSAKKVYLDVFDRGDPAWQVDVLAAELTHESVEQALREGPYGRCVYRCDNDVVDHQVVNVEFADGRTGVFTMAGFSKPEGNRETVIFGTHGELRCDGDTVTVYDFRTDEVTTYPIEVGNETILGHAGGDPAMIRSFVEALCTGDTSHLLSGADETLASHLTVFAAERARREGRVMEVSSQGTEVRS